MRGGGCGMEGRKGGWGKRVELSHKGVVTRISSHGYLPWLPPMVISNGYLPWLPPMGYSLTLLA